MIDVIKSFDKNRGDVQLKNRKKGTKLMLAQQISFFCF